MPHLVEKYYDGDLEKAVAKALNDVEGSYAVIVLMAGEPRLVVARKDSPLIIGVGDRENFIGSDVPAVLDYTGRVIYLEDGDVGVITKEGVNVSNGGKKVKREEQRILWSVEEAQKSGYEHFMLKEIHEQPRVIRNTLGEYSRTAEDIEGLLAMRDSGIESMLMIACGTSYHAAMIGKYVIEELLRIPVRVELASEFNYYSNVLARMVAIAITQSGETADTLKAMKKLKEVGCRVVAVTNVVGSTASRIGDQTIYTRAGPEMSVAATKSFVAQLIALYWLTLNDNRIDLVERENLISQMRQLPGAIQQVLDNEEAIAACARKLAGSESVFYVGRGVNYPMALEGALKLKEISYIHAEGYAAGELKHGPFALLGSNAPVVAIVSDDGTRDALLANIREIKARKSPVIALSVEDDADVLGPQKEIRATVVKPPFKEDRRRIDVSKI